MMFESCFFSSDAAVSYTVYTSDSEEHRKRHVQQVTYWTLEIDSSMVSSYGFFINPWKTHMEIGFFQVNDFCLKTPNRWIFLKIRNSVLKGRAMPMSGAWSIWALLREIREAAQEVSRGSNGSNVVWVFLSPSSSDIRKHFLSSSHLPGSVPQKEMRESFQPPIFGCENVSFREGFPIFHFS